MIDIYVEKKKRDCTPEKDKPNQTRRSYYAKQMMKLLYQVGKRHTTERTKYHSVAFFYKMVFKIPIDS